MKNVKRVIAAALISVIAVGAAGCNMVSKTESGIKKSKVATFYNEKITRGQLDEKMAGIISAIKQQYGEDYEKNEEAKAALQEQKELMVENMVTEGIILKKAKELKVTPEEKALEEATNKKLEELKGQYTEDIVKNAGYTGGYTDPKFKEFARNSVIIEKLHDEVTKNEKVEDKEVSDYYNTNKLQFTTKPNTIHVAHILSATEADAKKVKERLDKGEAFDKVAKEVSTEPAAKESGGDLGEVPYVNSGMDQTFMNAALALNEGTISGPVQTQFGWHIIKTIKKTEYPYKPFDEVKADISKNLLEQKKSTKFQAEIANWQKEAKIEYFKENY